MTFTLTGIKINQDWHKEQQKKQAEWKAELGERRRYFEAIKPEYENICKLIGFCIYQYIGDKTFKPEILMQDFDFLNMDNMEAVMVSYGKYIEFVRKQPYMIKQLQKKKNPQYSVMYAPWSFKDRWMRVMKKLTNLGFISTFTANVHGSNMTFYKFNEEKIIELKKEAFVHFI